MPILKFGESGVQPYYFPRYLPDFGWIEALIEDNGNKIIEWVLVKVPNYSQLP